MTDGPTPALRKDAEQNRQRLLVAARELFAERGLGVTLNDIAHHAGVGVGTAYRRFANKGEVIDALFDSQIEELARIADVALATDDPWHGLTTYLEQCLALQARDRGIAHLLAGTWNTAEQHERSRARIADKVNTIADRAREVGALRPDVHGTDLIFVQIALNAVLDRTRSLSPDFYRRHLWLLLDGLRTHPDQPSQLPVPALTTDQTHAVMGPTSGR